jgi:hypothetical protein
MLNNPSIATVYDFETDADEAFLIMEFVDGASLELVLEDLGGPLDLDETAAVVGAVAEALEFAHDNGVLHLDIKPANVLISRDGRVKVADFGMAALSSAAGHGPSGGGTLGYMPLEQLEGMHVSVATDEWAIAVLAYECLTGANPFDDETVEAAIVRLEVFEPPRPSAYGLDLPNELDDVLLAGTGPRPSDRYPSVAAFADALLPHLGDSAAGRASLAGIVAAYAEDETVAEETGLERVGLWDRLRGPAGAALLRAVAAIESGWLTWAGLAPLRLQAPALAGAVALVALAGALSPSLGTGLGLIAFSAGLYSAHLWLLASVFTLGSLVWWWLIARRSPGAAVLPLSAPVLGVAHIPYAMPLLAGFALPPLEAAAAALVGGALAVLASASSAALPPYEQVAVRIFVHPQAALLVGTNVSAAFANPATWVALLGWPLAAAVMSLWSRRATRRSALFGALSGAVVLVGAHTLASAVSSALGRAIVQWRGTAFAFSLAGSLILVLLVTALGAPVRAEEDDLVRLVYDDDE